MSAEAKRSLCARLHAGKEEDDENCTVYCPGCSDQSNKQGTEKSKYLRVMCMVKACEAKNNLPVYEGYICAELRYAAVSGVRC